MSIALPTKRTNEYSKIWIPDPFEAWECHNGLAIKQAELVGYYNLGTLANGRDAWRLDLLERYDRAARVEKGPYQFSVRESSRQSLTWGAVEELLPREAVDLLRRKIEAKPMRQLCVKV